MVGHAVLREVIGANLFRAVAGADLPLAVGSKLFRFFLLLYALEQRPEGLWITRTADSTLFTFWPPLPPALDVSKSRSAGFRTNFDFLRIGSTATDAVEV